MLSDVRVLDLTDERGQLAGHMLAQLGADVVLVEPPGGSSSRRIGPFVAGRNDAEASLAHWAHNRGKRSVVLDFANSDADRQRLLDLAATADVLIESAAPGEMAGVGLSYEQLAAVNPGLVYVSITPFGQHGPKAGWPATDLTVWASSMAMVLSGDDDRAPVRVSVPQAFLHAASDAACAALVALHERHSSGLGQHVDISAQQSSLQATQSTVLSVPFKTDTPSRAAGAVRVGPLHVQLSWRCKDGHVAITFLFGAAIAPYTHRLMEWVCEEGFCDEATRDKDWVEYTLLLLTGQEPLEEYERVKQVVGDFTATKTKQELLDGALERRLLIAPVATIDDVLESPHYRDRGYWDQVEDPALSESPVTAPGAIAKLSGTPLPVLSRAPRLGEHTAQVLESARGRSPAIAAPASSNGAAGPSLPLSGVKVVDFMWVMAGPAITRAMADLGATVVKVESSTRVDTARTITPFFESVPDPERAGLYLNMNAGKIGCSINMAKPGAREVVLDLVKWADVVTESFSPRAMRQWGLSYDELVAVNPSVIMLSSCLMGQTGPMSSFAGFGNLAAAIAGFFNITGWPDRAPAGPFGAYTDYVSPRYGMAVLLAALDHRRRTGEGQHIDLSQAEASMHFIASAVLDKTVNGHTFERIGNDDPNMAPHGVFRCAGEDQWVAIACADDDQWRSLCGVIGRSDLAADDGLRSVAGRRSRREDLAKAIEEFTSGLSPQDATDRCIAAGVPAHGVSSSEQCTSDPQLLHRGHFVEVEHSTLGTITVEGSRTPLSRTPARVERAAPAYGQDTYEVLQSILGYSEDKIGDLYASEILE